MPLRPNSLFISHASEDKASFVRELARSLKRYGLQVWYDEYSLRPGDSLRRSIDKGLRECAAGVVVLSPSFFAKEWPQRELDALYSAEIAGQSKIIPIWHDVDAKYIASVSPLLLDRLAINSAKGGDAVAFEIAGLFPDSTRYTGSALADLLRFCASPSFFAKEALLAGCRYRFLQLNAFKEDYQVVFEQTTSNELDLVDELSDDAEAHLSQEFERLRVKHGIPEDVYLTSDEPVREWQLESYMSNIDEWASGTLAQEDCAKLIEDLDLDELDEYYILLGIPNFSFSQSQRPLLQLGLIALGCEFEDSVSLDVVCDRLGILDSED